jgi:hypothetical protein
MMLRRVQLWPLPKVDLSMKLMLAVQAKEEEERPKDHVQSIYHLTNPFVHSQKWPIADEQGHINIKENYRSIIP